MGENMRIAIISDASLPTPHPMGHGLGLMNYQIAEGLRARGHDTTLIAVRGSQFSGKLIALDVQGYEGEPALAKAAYHLNKEQPFDAILDAGHIHMLPGMFPHLPIISLYHDNFQP